MNVNAVLIECKGFVNFRPIMYKMREKYFCIWYEQSQSTLIYRKSDRLYTILQAAAFFIRLLFRLFLLCPYALLFLTQSIYLIFVHQFHYL